MTSSPVGRRRAIKVIGAAGLGAFLASCKPRGPAQPDATVRPTATASPVATKSSQELVSLFDSSASCKITPEQTEGPFYIDVNSIRGDIREDREGTPLRVAARVLDRDGCTPLPDCLFEIWHCDAGGLYSGFEAASRGGGNQRDKSRYLRGAQVTDLNGIAQMTTIYPGWYPGRTPHIHAKVILNNRELVTTQFYFDDAVSTEVFATRPYEGRGRRDTFNEDDGIYIKETTLTVSKDDAGYLGLITVGVA